MKRLLAKNNGCNGFMKNKNAPSDVDTANRCSGARKNEEWLFNMKCEYSFWRKAMEPVSALIPVGCWSVVGLKCCFDSGR